jgi:hypothetical protein
VSAARLQLALENKLTIAAMERSFRSKSCMVRSTEPIEVSTVARVNGMAWDKGLCVLAAKSNNLELLQWLHKNGCPWTIDEVAAAAVYANGIHTLKWLQSVEPEWSDSLKQKLLFAAAWLRVQRAEWPRSFVTVVENSDPDEDLQHECWSVSTVQWAMSNGCGWGAWKCSKLKPLLFQCAGTQENTEDAHNAAECTVEWCHKKRACQLFAWAHENGCPCTCEADAAAAVAVAAVAVAAQQQQQLEYYEMMQQLVEQHNMHGH